MTELREETSGLLDARGILALKALAAGIAAFVIWRLGWISDDGLITLRHALNFSHGWGPGFNSAESVQGYTSPLWFVLWLTIGALTDNWIYGIIIFGLFLTVMSLVLTLSLVKTATGVAAVTGAFVLSNAVMEYSTSGLENSLAFLSVTGLFLLLAKAEQVQSRVVATFAGLAFAALILTRFDLALIAFAAVLHLAWLLRRDLKRLAVFLSAASIPILIWFSWSQITYGSILPNTFAAKRNLEIPFGEIIDAGLTYLKFSVMQDPVTGVIVLAGVLIGLLLGTDSQRFWALGIILYLGYVVSNGGDFMAGRFLAVPVVVAILILASWGAERLARFERKFSWFAFEGVVIAVIGTGLVVGSMAFTENIYIERWRFLENDGIADERGFYVANAKYGTSGETVLPELQASTREWPHPNKNENFRRPNGVGVTCGGLGRAALFSGPRIHWIDSCGLTDRFLASIPFSPDDGWRVGHYVRDIPEGYVRAVEYDDPEYVVNLELRRDLEEIWSVIR